MVVRAAKDVTGTLFPGRSSRQHEFSSGTEHARRYKLSLLVGFALFIAGVSAAHFNPADGYEVSIYWATPTLYWIGAGGALLVALTTLLYGHDTRFAPLAVLLGGLSVASFLALPIIRDYYFFGYADPMTHLGQVRALWGGWMSFTESIYPGSYVFAVFVGQLGGLPANRAMLYVLFAMSLVFVVFVPLAVYTIVPDRRALFVGLFSGFLLLPVNNVSTSFIFHPYSMNALYSTLVIYLLIGHFTRAFEDDTLPSFLSATSFVLPIATAALLFFHPQTTSDVLIIFGVIAGVQLFYRLFKSDHPMASYRAVYGQFVFLAALFIVWAGMHDGASQTLDLLVQTVISWVTGTAEPASNVTRQANSMETLDISIYEMFAKLFLVSSVYCVLAAGVALAQFVGLLGEDRDGSVGSFGTAESADSKLGTLRYFLFAGLGLLPYVLIHSFGKAGDYLFRHIGFAMVIVTILGAVGLYYVLARFGRSLGSTLRNVGRPAFGAIAAAVIVLSLLSVYASPFIYLPGQHVSEYQMDGYQTAFEMQPDDRTIWFGGVRQSSNRYEEAMFAAPNSPWGGSPDAVSSGAVTDDNITDLQEHYRTHFEPVVQRDHYFVLSEKAFETELVAYRSIRYSRANMSSIPQQESVYNIYSNGGYRLFYVDTAGDPIINESAVEDAEANDSAVVEDNSSAFDSTATPTPAGETTATPTAAATPTTDTASTPATDGSSTSTAEATETPNEAETTGDSEPSDEATSDEESEESESEASTATETPTGTATPTGTTTATATATPVADGSDSETTFGTETTAATETSDGLL